MNDNFNTTFGWVLFSGIIALGLSIASGMYFHGDHMKAPEKPGYYVEDTDAGAGAKDEGPPMAQLMQEGEMDMGKAVFAKCMACHTIDAGGADGIGPNLNGILGSGIAGHSPGYAYSSALKEKGGTWTYEAMDEWLKSPAAFAPGTKMSFAGLSKGEDRANLMIYLKENGGGPPLPEFDAEAAAAEAAAAEAEAEAGETDLNSDVVGGSVAAVENANEATDAGADASPAH